MKSSNYFRLGSNKLSLGATGQQPDLILQSLEHLAHYWCSISVKSAMERSIAPYA